MRAEESRGSKAWRRMSLATMYSQMSTETSDTIQKQVEQDIEHAEEGNGISI